MVNRAQRLPLPAIFGGALCIIVAAVVGMWLTRAPPYERTVIPDMPQRTEPAVAHPQRLERLRSRVVIGSDRPHNVPSERNSLPFDTAAIHTLLTSIELESDGMPVLDRRVLATLRAGFATLRTELSEAQLQELQAIISSALPGVAGEQAAQLAGDYYRYAVALKNLESSTTPVEDANTAQVRYDQQVALREQHFGRETARKLFGREQEIARFTIESMRIQEQAALSQGDKDRLQESLREQLPPGVLPDKPAVAELQWQQRFAQFAQERHMIRNAGLTEHDQQEQIERLLAMHFRPHELERARRYVAVEGSED